jgi:hypothetical protein
MSTLPSPPFSPPSRAPERHWMPLVFGAVLVVLVVGSLVVLSRRPSSERIGDLPTDPYADDMAISDPHLSTAHNFVGGTVYYIEGSITNAGDKTVTGLRMEAIFRNSLGQVVQKEVQPLMLLHARPGYDDAIPVSAAPLAPKTHRDFRLAFEHISNDWNQGYPELRIVKVTTK